MDSQTEDRPQGEARRRMPPVVAMFAKSLLDNWVCDLLNMQNLPQTQETKAKVLAHVEKLTGFEWLEDVYVIDVDLMKGRAEIEVKSHDDDCLQLLQDFTDWVRDFTGGSFYLRFDVFLYHGSTTFPEPERETS